MTDPATPANGALVLFSGGQDSTVCLAWALTRHERVETVGFDYGQRHAVEMQARQAVRAGFMARFPQWPARLGEDHVLDIRGFGEVAQTALARSCSRPVQRLQPAKRQNTAGRPAWPPSPCSVRKISLTL